MSCGCGNVPCRHIVITNNNCDESVTVTQPLIGTVKVTAVGPQGPRGFSFPYTGSADITGSLTVTGSFNHSGAYFVDHLVITHSNGSTYQVGDTEYIIFNTWPAQLPGQNNADIFLPLSTENEGRLLRFKSDETINSNHNITLNPYSGDSATIDGDTTVDFNREYDGITLLCHSANWYIIQRKAK